MTAPSDALVIIDVQNDFLPGGRLAVPDGDAVIAPVNRLAARFPMVILTQDWHPAGHASFASAHAGRSPFETIEVGYGPQVLWPDHCVQGSEGAALSAALKAPHAQLVVRKGYHTGIDSYSAFLEADRRTPTGLAGYLRERGIGRLVLAGLALDYCVGFSALDAAAMGFGVTVAEDACRGIDLDGSVAKAWAAMERAGVVRAQSDTLRPGA